MPGAANVIAGDVRFTLDVRAGDRRGARRQAARCDPRRGWPPSPPRAGLVLPTTRIFELPASPCDPALMDAARRRASQQAASRRCGWCRARGTMPSPWRRCARPPCCSSAAAGGISHNPAEHVEPADAEVALQVMLHFIELLGASLELLDPLLFGEIDPPQRLLMGPGPVNAHPARAARDVGRSAGAVRSRNDRLHEPGHGAVPPGVRDCRTAGRC